MMQINLIPRKPFIEKYFTVLIIGIAGLFLIVLLGVVAAKLALSGSIDREEQKIQELQQKTASEIQRRTPDDWHTQYKLLSDAAKGLTIIQPDWNTVLDTLANQMPNFSRVDAMEVDAKGTMKLSMTFLRKKDISDFIILMNDTAMVQDLRILTIKKWDNTLGGDPEESNPEETEFAATETGNELPGTEDWSLTVPGSEPGATYEDPLLQQWNDILDGKVPAEVLPDPAPTPAPTTPTEPSPSPTPSEDAPADPVIEYPVELSMLEGFTYPYYEVTLEMDVVPFSGEVSGP